MAKQQQPPLVTMDGITNLLNAQLSAYINPLKTQLGFIQQSFENACAEIATLKEKVRTPRQLEKKVGCQAG